MYVSAAVVFVIVSLGRTAASCDVNVLVPRGSAIQTLDDTVCAKGTLTLVNGSHTFGAVVLRNAAALVGSGNTELRGLSITFNQLSLTVSLMRMMSDVIAGDQLVVTDSVLSSRNITTRGGLACIKSTVENSSIVIGNSGGSVSFDLCRVNSSSVLYERGGSQLVLLETELYRSMVHASLGEVRDVRCEACVLRDSTIDTSPSSGIIRCNGTGLANVSMSGASLQNSTVIIEVLRFAQAGLLVTDSNAVSSSISFHGDCGGVQLHVSRSRFESCLLEVSVSNGGQEKIVITASDNVLIQSTISIEGCGVNMTSHGNNYTSSNYKKHTVSMIPYNGGCGNYSIDVSSTSDIFEGFGALSIDSTGSVSARFMSLQAFSSTNSTSLVWINSTNSSAVIESCVFMSSGFSSAMKLRGGHADVKVTDSKFYNTVPSMIGAIDVGGSGPSSAVATVSVMDTAFVGSRAITLGNGSGWCALEISKMSCTWSEGCISVGVCGEQVKVSIRDSVFNNSRGIDVYVSKDAYVETLRSNFSETSGSIAIRTGRLCRGLRTNVSACRFVGGHAGNAVSRQSETGSTCTGEVFFSDTQFIKNEGEGLIDLQGTNQVEFARVSVVLNKASGSGVIRSMGGLFTCLQCVVDGNVARGAMINVNGSVEVSNIIARNNRNIDAAHAVSVIQCTTLEDVNGSYENNTGKVIRGSRLKFVGTSVKGSQIEGQAILSATNCSFENIYSGAINGNNGTVSISGSSFTDVATGSDGGAIYSLGGNVTVSGSNFTNVYAVGNGGGIFCDSGDVSISGSIFQGAMAGGNGGAVYGFRGTLNVSGSHFRNAVAGGEGGAVSCNRCTTNVTRSNFTNVTAVIDGGAICGYRSTVMVSDSSFIGTSSKGDGGAINGVYVLIVGCFFNDVRALRGGGIASVDGRIVRSMFSRSSAKLFGGAVYISSHGVVEDCVTFETSAAQMGGSLFFINQASISNVTISKSSAVLGGGCVQCYGVLTIRKSTFHDCHSSGKGGCILTQNLSAIDVRFSQCASDMMGGAIHSGVADLTSTTLQYCTAAGSGSAVRSTSVSFYNVSISGCVTKSGSGTVSGVVCTVSRSSFNNNSAPSGGGLSCADATVIDSLFSNNTVLDVGGAIYSANLTIVQSSTFVNNTALSTGGAIRCSGGVRVSDSVFHGHRASNGGAVSCSYFEGSNISMTGNSGIYGGALFVANEINVTDATFVGNVANDGSVLWSPNTCTVNAQITTFKDNVGNSGMITGMVWGAFTGCVFAGNVADQLFMYSRIEGCPLVIQDCEFVGNQGAIVMSQGMQLNVTSTNITNVTQPKGGSTIEVSRGKVYLRGAVFDTFSGLSFEHSIVTVQNSRLRHSNGSALSVSNGTLVVEVLSCERNTAVNGSCIQMWKIRECNLSRVDSYLDHSTQYGGSVYIDGSGGKVMVKDSSFNGSQGGFGGAMYAHGVWLSLRNTTAQLCTAIGAMKSYDVYIPDGIAPGSALLFVGDGELHIEGSRFDSCRGGYGTVAVFGNSTVSLGRTLFTNNTVSYGGGIAVGDGQCILTLSDVQFSLNKAVAGSSMYGTSNGQVSFGDFTTTSNVVQYGGDVSPRADDVIPRVFRLDGSEVISVMDVFDVPVGIDFLLRFELWGASHYRSDLGPDRIVTVNLYGEGSGTLLGNVKDFLWSSGELRSPAINVIGNIGDIVGLVMSTPLLRQPYTFRIKLSGCPLYYGLKEIVRGGVVAGASCGLCSNGSYSFGGSGKCHECGDNMLCDYATTGGVPMSDHGYWLTRVDKNGRVRAVKCPIADLCLKSQCNTGHNMTSPVCGECVVGMHHWDGRCGQCKNDYKLMAVAFLLMFAGVNVYALFVHQTALPSADASLKILMQYSQVALLVMPEIPSAQSIGMPVQILSGNVGQATTVLPCFIMVSPVVIFHSSGVFAGVSLITLLIHRWILALWRRRKGAVVQSGITANSLISLLFMCVFGTTSSLLDFLTCVDGGEVRVVLKAPSIQCSSKAHSLHTVILAVYTIAAWGALLGILCKIVMNYKDTPERTIGLWTFLFYHFKNEFPDRSAYLSRWGYYRSQLRAQLCRWWQCIILARRVIILVAYVLGKRQIINAPQTIIIILLLFLYLHLLVNPYKSWQDDVMDGLGSVLLMVATLFSYAHKGGLSVIMCGWAILGAYLINGVFGKAQLCLSGRATESGLVHSSSAGSWSSSRSSSATTIGEIYDAMASTEYTSSESHAASHAGRSDC